MGPKISYNLLKESIGGLTYPEFRFMNKCVSDSMIGYWTDRSDQTAQTKIRLLLMDQSCQLPHCSLFCHYF